MNVVVNAGQKIEDALEKMGIEFSQGFVRLSNEEVMLASDDLVQAISDEERGGPLGKQQSLSITFEDIC